MDLSVLLFLTANNKVAILYPPSPHSPDLAPCDIFSPKIEIKFKAQ